VAKRTILRENVCNTKCLLCALRSFGIIWYSQTPANFAHDCQAGVKSNDFPGSGSGLPQITSSFHWYIQLWQQLLHGSKGSREPGKWIHGPKHDSAICCYRALVNQNPCRTKEQLSENQGHQRERPVRYLRSEFVLLIPFNRRVSSVDCDAVGIANGERGRERQKREEEN
jgi:hypothetical protein